MQLQLSPNIAALLVASIIWLAVEFRQSRRTRPAATKAQDRCSKVFTFAPAAGIVIDAVLSWTEPGAAIRPPWLTARVSGHGKIPIGGREGSPLTDR